MEKDLYGGRKQSAWNTFVHSRKGSGKTMSELSAEYRSNHRVLPRPKPSECAKKERSKCLENIHPSCSWVVQKKKSEKGVLRREYCKKSYKTIASTTAPHNTPLRS